MGAFNATINGVSPNLYVDANGQIMRVTGSTKRQIPAASHQGIDLPLMQPGTSGKVTLNVEGCVKGQTAFASPESELPDGLVIAYCRVSKDAIVEIKFINCGTSTIDPERLEFLVSIQE